MNKKHYKNLTIHEKINVRSWVSLLDIMLTIHQKINLRSRKIPMKDWYEVVYKYEAEYLYNSPYNYRPKYGHISVCVLGFWLPFKRTLTPLL